MRLSTAVISLAFAAVVSTSQLSFAEQLNDGRSIKEAMQDYRTKALNCRQVGDANCSAACVQALQFVRQGPSAELDSAAKDCDSGFAAIQAEREKELAKPSLREGYVWMPDVEATVIRARGAPFLVEGRSDWEEFCSDGARLGGAALDAASKQLTRTPGKQVVLQHLQRPVRRTPTLDCIVGDVVEKP